MKDITYEQVRKLSRGSRTKYTYGFDKRLHLAIAQISEERTRAFRAANPELDPRRTSTRIGRNATIARAVLNGDSEIRRRYDQLIKEENDRNQTTEAATSPQARRDWQS